MAASNADSPDRSGYRFPGPPPEEAIRFFEDKEIWPSFSYLDVWREEHATVFTVAKTVEYDVVAAIHAAARKALVEGQTFQQFQKELTPILQKAGWWGKKTMVDPKTGEEKLVELGSPRRLKTIFQTNMRTAQAAGQWERIQRTKDGLPYLLYTLGPSKEHRVEHVGWYGTCLPVDDPWWKTHMPPNGWGCKCRVRQVSQWEYDRLKKTGVPAPEAPPILGPDGRPTGHRAQKNVPIRASAPPEGQPQRWVNTRTGEEELVPYGFDPGWDYNAGIVGLAERQQQAQWRLEDKMYTESVQQAIDYVLIEGRKLQDEAIEFAVVVKRKGGEILRKRGEPHAVPFTAEEKRQMRGATLVHNHPGSGSFSIQDIMLAGGSDLLSIVAAGHGGEIYTASMIRAIDSLAFAVSFSDELEKIAAPLLTAGRITLGEIAGIHQHLMWAVADRLDLLRYRVTGTPPATPAEFDGLVNALVKRFSEIQWKVTD